jgi:DNA-binding MarR family transcriptional regulator
MGKPIEQALDECLFFSVKKLDRILNKMADEAFRKTGLAPTYAFILLVLMEKDGLPQKDIAQILFSAPSTIARFVEKLEYKGLIKTVVDGRKSLVYLTDAGRELSKEIDLSWDELHAAYGKVLGQSQSDEFAKELSVAAEQLKEKHK